MKKNSFLVFITSLIPGAGHMYFGMMKKGLLLMSVFSATIFLAGFFYMEFLLWLLPGVWFYSFFDTYNLKHLSYEEIQEQNKNFIQGLQGGILNGLPFKKIIEKRHLVLGVICVFAGIYLVINRVVMQFLAQYIWDYSSAYYRLYAFFNGYFPTLLIGVCIIALGIYLVRGKKRRADEDITVYRGKDENDD